MKILLFKLRSCQAVNGKRFPSPVKNAGSLPEARLTNEKSIGEVPKKSFSLNRRDP
jgi:hypothetical protein